MLVWTTRGWIVWIISAECKPHRSEQGSPVLAEHGGRWEERGHLNHQFQCSMRPAPQDRCRVQEHRRASNQACRSHGLWGGFLWERWVPRWAVTIPVYRLKAWVFCTGSPFSLAKLMKSSLDLLSRITKKGIPRRKCRGTQYCAEPGVGREDTWVIYRQRSSSVWEPDCLGWRCSSAIFYLRSWPTYFLSQSLFLNYKMRTWCEDYLRQSRQSTWYHPSTWCAR